MTEAEWLTSDNLTAMLRFLIGRASCRKKRLFACACCRDIWPLLTDERSRRAVEVSERYADGLADAGELEQARVAANAAAEEAHERYLQEERSGPRVYTSPGPPPPWLPAWRQMQALVTASCAATDFLDDTEGGPYQDEPRPVWGDHADVVRNWTAPLHAANSAGNAEDDPGTTRRHAALVRDLFGKPWRFPLRNDRDPPADLELSKQPGQGREWLYRRVWWVEPLFLDGAWFRWGGGVVPALARDIYEGGCWGELPVLADALEEAGCAEADILDHCRSGVPHARGCWVVDALLGKE
jgi:hypothetical protein